MLLLVLSLAAAPQRRTLTYVCDSPESPTGITNHDVELCVLPTRCLIMKRCFNLDLSINIKGGIQSFLYQIFGMSCCSEESIATVRHIMPRVHLARTPSGKEIYIDLRMYVHDNAVVPSHLSLRLIVV